MNLKLIFYVFRNANEEKDMPYEALKKLAMDISTTGTKKL